MLDFQRVYPDIWWVASTHPKDTTTIYNYWFEDGDTRWKKILNIQPCMFSGARKILKALSLCIAPVASWNVCIYSQVPRPETELGQIAESSEVRELWSIPKCRYGNAMRVACDMGWIYIYIYIINIFIYLLIYLFMYLCIYLFIYPPTPADARGSA
jgi:hypothetical protein